MNLGFSVCLADKNAAGTTKQEMTVKSSRLPVANKLLAALPRSEYDRLLPQLETITLTYGDILLEVGDVIEYVYFPSDSLVSLLTLVDSHHALEVGMVGNEGLVGVGFALGINTSPVRAMVQGSGTAQRMKASRFRSELKQSAHLQKAVSLYTHALMAQIAQTAACNRFHNIEARLARWLLMTRDRVGANQFHLTQEFLSDMLGVRRVGVTKAAHALKKRDLIEYSRGDIDIVDGRGLEKAACSCYQLTNGIHHKG